jgi:hypothetical protein
MFMPPEEQIKLYSGMIPLLCTSGLIEWFGSNWYYPVLNYILFSTLKVCPVRTYIFTLYSFRITMYYEVYS